MPVKFSLVVPTYNEETNIRELCRKITNVLDALPIDSEIIIVDDNSPDGTWRAAQDLAKQDKRLKVVRRISQRGLASAVVCGWAASEGEILGVIDADLQHPPEILAKMINKILNDNEVDIVVASRYIAGGGISKNNFWQTLRSQLAIFLGFIFVPRIFKSVKDSMSGYFILRKKVISGKQFRPMGYKILLEVLAIGNYRKVCEIPYNFAVRQGGETKTDWKQCLFYLLNLITLRTRQKQYF